MLGAESWVLSVRVVQVSNPGESERDFRVRQTACETLAPASERNDS